MFSGQAVANRTAPLHPPLEAKERAVADLARADHNAWLAMHDGLRDGLLLRPDVKRALEARPGQRLVLAGGRHRALELHSDGKIFMVKNGTRAPASWRDAIELDIYAGQTFKEVLDTRIARMMSRTSPPPTDHANQGLYDWPTGSATASRGSGATGRATVLRLELDRLAPQGWREKIDATLARHPTSTPPDEWDLPRLAAGGVDLHDRMLGIRSDVESSDEHSIHLTWKVGGDPMLAHWVTKRSIFGSEHREGPETSRSRLRQVGIRDQNDLDAAIFLAISERVATLPQLAGWEAQQLRNPASGLDPTQRKEAARSPQRRAELRQAFYAFLDARSRLLPEPERARPLDRFLRGESHQDDLRLLARLRDLAPPSSDAALVLAATADEKRSLVVQNSGNRPIMGIRSVDGGQIQFGLRAPALYQFGLVTGADLDAAVGRAVLKYSPESFLR